MEEYLRRRRGALLLLSDGLVHLPVLWLEWSWYSGAGNEPARAIAEFENAALLPIDFCNIDLGALRHLIDD